MDLWPLAAPDGNLVFEQFLWLLVVHVTGDKSRPALLHDQ